MWATALARFSWLYDVAEEFYLCLYESSWYKIVFYGRRLVLGIWETRNTSTRTLTRRKMEKENSDFGKWSKHAQFGHI